MRVDTTLATDYFFGTTVGPTYPTSFFFQMFFYLCDKSQATLFCLQKRSNIAANQDIPYFCLQTDDNGQLLFYLLLQKLGPLPPATVDYYPLTNGETGVYLTQGWNWLGIRIEQLYGYSMVKIYKSDESQSTGNRHTIATFYWEGDFKESNFGQPELILGCRVKDRTNPHQYSACMKGWLYAIKVSSTSDYASETAIAATHICTTDSKCNFCAQEYGATCWEYDKSKFIIQKWDLNSNSYYSSGIYSTYSPYYHLAQSTDRYQWPLAIPNMGTYFNESTWSYYLQDSFSGSTYYFPFPPMFSIDSWIKFDTLYPAPNSTLMTIFGKFTSSTPNTPSSRVYKVGYSVANYFMRVYINSQYYDFDYPFLGSANWYHIQVSYQLLRGYQYTTTSTTNYYSTLIQVYINGVQQISQVINDALDYTFSGYLIIGDQFKGLIRKVQVLNRVPCITSYPEMLSTSCSGCTFCDTIDGCYADCGIRNWYNTTLAACIGCDNSCHTCDSSGLCYTCKTSAYFMFNHTLVPTTPTSTKTCICPNGTYHNTTSNTCETCNDACLICTDKTTYCTQCAEGYFLEYNNSCVKACPYNYRGNSITYLCEIDKGSTSSSSSKSTATALQDRVLDEWVVTPGWRTGCMAGTTYMAKYGSCLDCKFNCTECLEVEGRKHCLACNTSLYLDWSGNCQWCRPKGLGMYVDSDKSCKDRCGDGRRFHENICDDGNLGSGDGCNSQCNVEQDYICRSGYEGTRDTCFWNPTIIKNAYANKQGDIIVEFSRPIYSCKHYHQSSSEWQYLFN